MKIEKVQNGFLVTSTELRQKEPQFQTYVMTTSYRIPMEEFENKHVFVDWAECQKFIRKYFGVTE